MQDIETTLRATLQTGGTLSSQYRDILNVMYQYIAREQQDIAQTIDHPACHIALPIDPQKTIRIFVHNPSYGLPNNREQEIALLALAALKKALIEGSTQERLEKALPLAVLAYDMPTDVPRYLVETIAYAVKDQVMQSRVYLNTGIRSTDNRVNLLRPYLLDILAQNGLSVSLQDRLGNPKWGNYDPTIWLERVLGTDYGLVEVREATTHELQSGFGFGVYKGTNLREKPTFYHFNQLTCAARNALERIKQNHTVPNITFFADGVAIPQGDIVTLDSGFGKQVGVGHLRLCFDAISTLLEDHKGVHCWQGKSGQWEIRVGCPLVWHSPKIGIAYAWCRLHEVDARQDPRLSRMQHMFDRAETFMETVTTRQTLHGEPYTLEMMNPTVRTGAELVNIMAAKIHDHIVSPGLGYPGPPQECGFDRDATGRAIVRPVRLLDMQEGWTYIYKIFEQYPPLQLAPLDTYILTSSHREHLEQYIERYGFYGVSFLSKPTWR